MSLSAFDRILARLEESDPVVTEKTAAVTDDAAARMLAKVREVSETATKVASTPEASPVADLATLAKSAADMEQTALLKEASFLGAAIADGFMTRFAAYDTALTAQGVKTASTPSPEVQQRIAQEAYAQGQADLEKQANAEYEAGYQQQMLEVHKLAAEVHLVGQATAREILAHNK